MARRSDCRETPIKADPGASWRRLAGHSSPQHFVAHSHPMTYFLGHRGGRKSGTAVTPAAFARRRRAAWRSASSRRAHRPPPWVAAALEHAAAKRRHSSGG